MKILKAIAGLLMLPLIIIVGLVVLLGQLFLELGNNSYCLSKELIEDIKELV
jgi:hypothetical protein